MMTSVPTYLKTFSLGLWLQDSPGWNLLLIISLQQLEFSHEFQQRIESYSQSDINFAVLLTGKFTEPVTEMVSTSVGKG